MRKLIYLSFLSFFLSQASYAQVEVIEYQDIEETVFNIQFLFYITLVAQEHADADQGVSFLYDMGDPDAEISTFFTEVESEDPNNHFPEATHALKTEVSFITNTTFLKYDEGEETISRLGVISLATGDEQVNVCPDPKILVQFPLDFGVEYSDTYSSAPLEINSGFQSTETGTRHTLGDATGTLVTPFGEYDDVVRLHITESGTQDNYFDGSLLNTIDFERITREYWTSEIPIPVASFTETTSNGEPAGVESSYLHSESKTTALEKPEEKTFFVFPNPASDQLTIQTFESQVKWSNVEVSLHSNDSKKITLLKPNALGHSSEIVYSIPSLAAGVYILQLRSDEMNWTKKLVIAQ